MKVDYGESLSYGDIRGTFKTVSDIEHVKIVDAYLEGKAITEKILQEVQVEPEY